nr:nidogen-2-like [Pocillopora verrucosa]
MFLFVVLERLSCSGLSDVVPCITKEFEEKVANKALLNHVISTPIAKTAESCEIQCFIEVKCESYNFGPNDNGDYLCELSASDGVRDPDDLRARQDFLHRATKNPCATAQCPPNSRCYSDFEHETYLCVCSPGFTGDKCESDLDECTDGKHACHVNAICNNSEGSYSCLCKDGYKGDGFLCEGEYLASFVPVGI